MTQKKANWGTVAAKAAPGLVKKLASAPEGPGRPIVHDPDKFQAEIVTRLVSGESLRMICRDETMPSLRTVNRWLAIDSDFADAVERGRQIGIWTLMDAVYDIASGGELSTGTVERDQLLCSVIKWVCGKRDPDTWRGLTAERLTIVLRDDETRFL